MATSLIHRAATCALAAVIGVVASPFWRSGGAAIEAQQGYQITKNSDQSHEAPPGYEGHTETSTQTAVGNTSATAGKIIHSSFTFGNLIKTCPSADGAAEGTGQFIVTQDRTDSQATGIGTFHTEMKAMAKYKGQVGDDAYLQSPVKADIDFTYTQTGSFRDKSTSARTTIPPSQASQHVTVNFTAGKKDAGGPDIGEIAGGDPAQTHLSDAYMVGVALTYWAGVYYSVAQFKWIGGESGPGGGGSKAGPCVDVVFSPPSNTMQLVLGGQVKVTAQAKTKTGEVVKAQFLEARPIANTGLVQPAVGASDVGSPMKFTYTAPAQKVAHPGFGTFAVSRAGVGAGEWETGLGKDWSGEITYSWNEHSATPANEMGERSDQETVQVTVTVKDGVGSATSFASAAHNSVSRLKALRGGALTLITGGTEAYQGQASGTSDAHVHVAVDKNAGTYSILPNWTPATGKSQDVVCTRDTCNTYVQDYPAVLSIDTGIQGKAEDLNHLSGTKSGQLAIPFGERSWSVTWNLARTGTN